MIILCLLPKSLKIIQFLPTPQNYSDMLPKMFLFINQKCMHIYIERDRPFETDILILTTIPQNAVCCLPALCNEIVVNLKSWLSSLYHSSEQELTWYKSCKVNEP